MSLSGIRFFFFFFFKTQTIVKLNTYVKTFTSMKVLVGPINKNYALPFLLLTLTCQIIVQDHLIVQVADFSEINKHVGLNKALQEGFFVIYIGENQVLKEKYQKLINVQVLIRLCRCFFPQKIIRFAARLFGSSEFVYMSSRVANVVAHHEKLLTQ